MNKKIIYLYILNTLADWEPGYAISELNTGRYFKKNAERYVVKTCALTKEPIKTLGGVTIVPDYTVDEINGEEAAMLILPGGDTWMEDQHEPLFTKVKELLEEKIPVAAICGATIGLANRGFLDNVSHTSNNLDFLKATCSGYQGSKHYSETPAVTSGSLITATGTAPLEFAYQIFKKLDIMSEETLEAWYNLYSKKEAKYFFALMESIKKEQ